MYRNLEAELARKNITRAQLAQVLGISVATVSEKMTKPGRLKIDEAITIRDALFPDMKLDYLFEIQKPISA